jgi:hypothetical protein
MVVDQFFKILKIDFAVTSQKGGTRGFIQSSQPFFAKGFMLAVS